MSKYVFTAFDTQGRVEIVRLIFAAAGVKYQDNRIPEFAEKDFGKLLTIPPQDWKFSEQWLAAKQHTPFNQQPNLEVDGVNIAMHATIHNFLGKRFGLAGKTELDAAKTSMINEAVNDGFYAPIGKIFGEKDPQKHAEAVKSFGQETVPKYLGNLEKLAGSKGYFVADQLTYADISFFHGVTWLTKASENGAKYPALAWLQQIKVEGELDKYPKLKAIKDNVAKHPGIAKWIKERPNTEF